MPPKQRASLYIKDDDYRLSFLQGSYITLTNLTDADWQRIADYRLSPLYISVHATEPKVRRELLGNKQASAIMHHLQRLAEWGCHFHAQAVLCPGINDGAVLEKTIADLEKFWPYLRTFALVPVGLTRHRAGLAPLRKFKPTEAAAVIDITHRAQQRFLSLYGSRLVFAADEFYLQADQKFPPLETYEDLLQLENGVGLWPLFKTQFLTALTEAYREGKKKPDRNFAVITGRGAAQLWQELSQAVAKKFPWLKLSVLPVRNHFFGDEVTVTGLVTGADIQSALREAQLRTDTCLLLPLVMLRHQEDVFLDGMTVDELRASVPFSIKVVGVNGEEAVKALLE
jgi:putative radical SAM enzyme (TIGR03279 family)